MIENDAYQRLLNRSKDPTKYDEEINKYNEKMHEKNIMDEKVKNDAWSDIGNRVSNMLTASDGTLVPELEERLGQKYLIRGMKFFTILKNLNGIKFKGNGIYFADKTKIVGSPSNIIANLVKEGKMLGYDSEPLLNKLISAGYGDITRNLLSNKEAKRLLGDKKAVESTPATPREHLSFSSPSDSIYRTAPRHVISPRTPRSRSKKRKGVTFEGSPNFYSAAQDKSGSNKLIDLYDESEYKTSKKKVKRSTTKKKKKKQKIKKKTKKIKRKKDGRRGGGRGSGKKRKKKK